MNMSMHVEPTSPPADPSATGIPHLRLARSGLLAAGQPAPEDWDRLRAMGVTRVVNLRTDTEMAGRDEAAEVAAAGMAYDAIPVEGGAGIDAANAERLRVLLAGSEGTVLVHCASGNRVGGLVALAAALDGMPAGEAVELGRRAGLGMAEPQVRRQLGLPAE
ncbi:beta-lactamase hydrolase domain-containing protein [Marilutibacter spongiae]|uniref:Tyrosine-protein phosphatase n=1 Tax=Marilutibacter spongiae TaxID=2025720 RepID=A0A7W3TKW2_9GAMM|nr:sulfur transferase domain-containing protein [Lysobacter spongiae]MBB1060176.1 tyrosine-protein phosphatase [Lysobacter spongiae]